MKNYEREMFRAFPELAYLTDYIWTPGSPFPDYSYFIAIVNNVSDEHPLIDEWLGTPTADIFYSHRTIGYEYYVLSRIHHDIKLYPEDIDLIIKDKYDNYLLIADTSHKKIVTVVGALFVPEVQEAIRGIFAKELLPNIIGNATKLTVKYEVPEVEEAKINFMADSKMFSEKIKLEAQITKLKREIEEVKHSTTDKMSSVIRTLIKAQRSGWQFETINNRIYLTLEQHIPMKSFIYQGDVYDVPEEFWDKYYTEKIEVNLDMWGGITISAWGNHPNLGSSGSVCLGDFVLSMSNFDELLQVPILMETGNLDSPLNARTASNIVEDILDEKKGKKSGLVITI